MDKKPITSTPHLILTIFSSLLGGGCVMWALYNIHHNDPMIFGVSMGAVGVANLFVAAQSLGRALILDHRAWTT